MDTKIKQAEKFLAKGNKVKIIIMLKGRENAHPERGYEFANKLTNKFRDIAIVESIPRLSGSNINILLRAKK